MQIFRFEVKKASAKGFFGKMGKAGKVVASLIMKVVIPKLHSNK